MIPKPEGKRHVREGEEPFYDPEYHHSRMNHSTYDLCDEVHNLRMRNMKRRENRRKKLEKEEGYQKDDDTGPVTYRGPRNADLNIRYKIGEGDSEES
jgi:hypothetical protein